jgi:hypothetical protein
MEGLIWVKGAKLSRARLQTDPRFRDAQVVRGLSSLEEGER